MKFGFKGFKFGFMGGDAGAVDNMCWNPLAIISGTIYGGEPTPNYTSDSTFFYNAQFDTSDGKFIFQFGVAGDEQLTNVSLATFSYNNVYEVDLVWDATNEYYSGINTTLATTLAAEVGNNTCGSFFVSPDEFLNLDLEEEST